MKWFCSAILMGLAVAVGVAACGGDDQSGDGAAADSGSQERRVAYVTFQAVNEFATDLIAGAQAGDEESDRVAVDLVEVTEFDTQSVIAAIENAATRQPGALSVIPLEPEPLVPALGRVCEQDIVVVAMDQDIPRVPCKASFVGTDNTKAGESAGKHMLEMVESGTIGILGSRPGVASIDQRVAGFQAALEGSGLEVLEPLRPGCETQGAGVSAMEDLLSAHPDLAGVFSTCDNIGLAAAQALRRAGGAEAVYHVSFDGQPEAIKQVASGDGLIDAEIAQRPFEMGRQTVLTMAQAVHGEDVPSYVNTGSELITQENAEEFLRESEARRGSVESE
jgi:ribose transport system substrate-binding protein